MRGIGKAVGVVVAFAGVAPRTKVDIFPCDDDDDDALLFTPLSPARILSHPRSLEKSFPLSDEVVGVNAIVFS